MRFHDPNRHLALFGLGMLLVACSVYDSNLLVGKTPDAVTQPQAGSQPLPPPTASGDASTPRPDDPPPTATNDAGDDDNLTRCGDGQVTGAERCDLSIPQGQPGACPSECPPLDNCAPRLLNGSGCQAECVLRELVCEGGDDCCPGKCTSDNDPDCSPSCGDGIVQSSRGETCDPASATACKKSVAECDDGNGCTTDALTGSASNCNTACRHDKITSPQVGDGCCPEGANATTDGDCKPYCGNGVREADEECDGLEGCDANCKITGNPAQMACLNVAADECGRCACNNCEAQEDACLNGPNAVENAKCLGVLTCSRKNNCTGTPCYCFDALCILPGPCVAEIQAAAGTTDAATIANAQNDTSTTLGKAYAADSCRVRQCRDSCR